MSLGPRPDCSSITVGAAIWDSMIPMTLGNIVGGAVLVGNCFWATCRRGDDGLAAS